MNYISTKELAELWGISKRRISMLASQGRIEGAEFVGGGWLFPSDVKKPSDPRKGTTKKDSKEHYVFPYLLACVHSDEQVNAFSPEEKELYRLCLVYESGDFASARELAEFLLSSKNQYIRIGALYHLPPICLYLYDFEAAENYYVLFNSEVLTSIEHKDELLLLYEELKAEFVSTTSFQVDYNISKQSSYSDEVIPYLFLSMLFSDIVLSDFERLSVSVKLYELYCKSIEKQGYFFCAIYFHLYLSVFYGATGSPENERAHMKKAIDIAIEHGTIFTLSYSIVISLDTALPILSEFPSEITEQVIKLGKLFLDARNSYSDYHGKSSILSKLTSADYELLSCCVKKQNIDTMAEIFGLSRSGMNRRLSNLYSKFGVSSKNELIKKYLSSLSEWGNGAFGN